MFWNNNNTSGSSSPPPPGNRRPGGTSSNNNNTTFIAPTIRGSIRGPTATASTIISRQEHLESYLNDETLKRSTRKVSVDDSTHDTVFQSIYGDTLILRVHWPVLTEQTQVPPAMTLAGVNAKHPWLDNRMCIVGYEPITNYKIWVASKILLGKAVHEVVNHLQLNPPEIIEITDAGLRSIQQPKTQQQQQLQQRQKQQQQQQASSMFSNNTHTSSPIRTSVTTTTNFHRSIDPVVISGSVTQQVQQPTSSSFGRDAPPKYESVVNPTTTTSTIPDIDLPPIPTRFNEIDALSKEELQKLWEDEGEFLTFCNNLPLMQTYGKILRSVLDENTVVAKKNLSKQEELQELYDACCKLEISLQTAVEQFQQLEQQQDVYCQPPDRKVVMKELVKAKKEAFDESEQIAKNWLDNVDATSVDNFLTEFVAKRKLHHERAAKLELVQSTPSLTFKS